MSSATENRPGLNPLQENLRRIYTYQQLIADSSILLGGYLRKVIGDENVSYLVFARSLEDPSSGAYIQNDNKSTQVIDTMRPLSGIGVPELKVTYYRYDQRDDKQPYVSVNTGTVNDGILRNNGGKRIFIEYPEINQVETEYRFGENHYRKYILIPASVKLPTSPVHRTVDGKLAYPGKITVSESAEICKALESLSRKLRRFTSNNAEIIFSRLY